MNDNLRRKYLRVEEIAEVLQVDRRRIYDEINAGRLACVRIGRRHIRIPAEAFEAWEKAQLEVAGLHQVARLR